MRSVDREALRPDAAPLIEHAPAKVNLTLKVRGRRPDGYHEIESLIAFARLGDRLRLVPGRALGIETRGPFADRLDAGENLVLKAAANLCERIEGLEVGRFQLWKRLPVASGIGGGSSDAAAALRLLVRLNALDPGDPRMIAAACATGADVPVCLGTRARLVCGIGEQLSEPLVMPALPAVLVNPGIPLATKDVFAKFGARTKFDPGSIRARTLHPDHVPRSRDKLVALLKTHRNELEAAAILLEPAVAEVLAELRALAGCELARMSGSGASCFGLFRSARSSLAAAGALRGLHPGWWVRATILS